ncbi:hypothetical protein O9992_26755 [Vibrio lentus]|nr:hypothetical protein [Vibrio lentus]
MGKSIYQSVGADVDLTTGFKDRFESSTIHHLDTTYRFNNQSKRTQSLCARNRFNCQKELEEAGEQKQKAVYSTAVKILRSYPRSKLNRQAKKAKPLSLSCCLGSVITIAKPGATAKTKKIFSIH